MPELESNHKSPAAGLEGALVAIIKFVDETLPVTVTPAVVVSFFLALL